MGQGKGKLRLREITAPATPPADEAEIYLGAGTPGTVFVKHDDGSVVDLEGGGLLSGVFVSAREWDAVPDTATDMTAEIQAAFDAAPAGCILVFDPGVYEISDTVHLARTINVIFDGVIFDLEANTPATLFSPGIPENYNGGYLSIASREAGTLTDRAAMIWGTDGGDRPVRNWIRGLTVRRTASAATAAARLHCGLLMLATSECRADNITAENFREGIVGIGGTAQGFAYNFGDNLKTTNCRYGLTLYCNRATGAGWANQNTFRGGRLFLESGIRGDGSWIEAQWEPIRLLWESGGTSPAPPNNNVFDFITIEGAYGRKIRCEGRNNSFRDIRYEDTHTAGTADITVGEASRTNSQFSRNFFVGGDDLGIILDRDNVEFLATVAINNGNTFIGGTANWFCARSETVRANHRFSTTSSTAPVISIGNVSDVELIRLHHVYASLSAQGALEFLDTGETIRNAIGMNTASPYDLRTLAGVNVANVFRVRIDGTIDAIIANPQTGGQILIPVATGLVKLWASSSGSDVFVVADSARDARLVLKAEEALGSGLTYLGVLKFYDDDATPTFMNAIGLHPSANLGGSRPILFERGVWINEMGADADSRVSGDTDTNLTYWDASAEGVGFGTNAPTGGVKVQIEGRAFLNGGHRVKRTGVTDVTLDADHFYVAVDSSAATRTITLPATDGTGIGSGKMYVIKRNGGNNVAINAAGSNTIDGAATQNLSADNASVTIVSNGGAGAAGDWEVV